MRRVLAHVAPFYIERGTAAPNALNVDIYEDYLCPRSADLYDRTRASIVERLSRGTLCLRVAPVAAFGRDAPKPFALAAATTVLHAEAAGYGDAVREYFLHLRATLVNAPSWTRVTSELYDRCGYIAADLNRLPEDHQDAVHANRAYFHAHHTENQVTTVPYALIDGHPHTPDSAARALAA